MSSAQAVVCYSACMVAQFRSQALLSGGATALLLLLGGATAWRRLCVQQQSVASCCAGDALLAAELGLLHSTSDLVCWQLNVAAATGHGLPFLGGSVVAGRGQTGECTSVCASPGLGRDGARCAGAAVKGFGVRSSCRHHAIRVGDVFPLAASRGLRMIVMREV